VRDGANILNQNASRMAVPSTLITCAIRFSILRLMRRRSNAPPANMASVYSGMRQVA
jgi:hypothetical protein